VTDIATSALALALAPRFSIGRTLSLSFAVLRRNLWRMSAIALSVTALQVAIGFYVPIAGTGLPRVVFALSLFAMVTTPVTVATLQHFRDGGPTLAGMLRGGLRRVVRVTIGTTILVFVVLVPPLALTMLYVFLELPQIMLMVAVGILMTAVYALAIFMVWFVAVPVLVAENVGIFSGFGRSRDLTRGHRWAVLALVLVLAIIVWAMMLIATTLRLSLVAYVPDQMMLYPWLSLALVPLGAFSSLMTATVPAAAYHLLQAEKEGGGVEVVARVFE
jgi:hypothetical protein